VDDDSVGAAEGGAGARGECVLTWGGGGGGGCGVCFVEGRGPACDPGQGAEGGGR